MRVKTFPGTNDEYVVTIFLSMAEYEAMAQGRVAMGFNGSTRIERGDTLEGDDVETAKRFTPALAASLYNYTLGTFGIEGKEMKLDF